MNPSIIQEAKREELTFGGMRVMETKKDYILFWSHLRSIMTKDGKKKTSSEIYEL